MLQNERLVPPDTLKVGCEPYFKTLAFSLLTSLNAYVNRSIKASNVTHRANGTVHFASCFASFATKSKVPPQHGDITGDAQMTTTGITGSSLGCNSRHEIKSNL